MNIATIERATRAAQAPLKDKVALVTGSTSGIGLGIARAMAAAGAAVVLNGFGKAEEITATKAAIGADFGVPVAYSAADMSKPEVDRRDDPDDPRYVRQARCRWSTMPAYSTWRRCRSSRSPSGTPSWPSISAQPSTPPVWHCRA